MTPEDASWKWFGRTAALCAVVVVACALSLLVVGTVYVVRYVLETMP